MVEVSLALTTVARGLDKDQGVDFSAALIAIAVHWSSASASATSASGSETTRGDLNCMGLSLGRAAGPGSLGSPLAPQPEPEPEPELPLPERAVACPARV